MTRLWQGGEVVGIETDGLVPTAILWETTWVAVTHILLYWEVDVQWWRQRIYRDYFKILTERGVLLVVYHDLVADIWALQRVYD